jgi:hypothetical protein
MDGWMDGKQLGNNFLFFYRQKMKNYGNSNISQAKMQSLKNPLKKTKILQGIITLYKPKYHLSKNLIKK